MDKVWADPVWVPTACNRCEKPMGSVNVAGRQRYGTFACMKMFGHRLRMRWRVWMKYRCVHCRENKLA